MHLVFTVFANLLTINTFVLILPIKWTTVRTFMCLTRGVHGGYPRYTANLVTSYQSGNNETCSIRGKVGSSPEQEKWSVHWAVLCKQLIRPIMDYAWPIEARFLRILTQRWPMWELLSSAAQQILALIDGWLWLLSAQSKGDGSLQISWSHHKTAAKST